MEDIMNLELKHLLIPTAINRIIPLKFLFDPKNSKTQLLQSLIVLFSNRILWNSNLYPLKLLIASLLEVVLLFISLFVRILKLCMPVIWDQELRHQVVGLVVHLQKTLVQHQFHAFSQNPELEHQRNQNNIMLKSKLWDLQH